MVAKQDNLTAIEAQAPFWFTGAGNALRDHICVSLNNSNERVFVSSSYLSEPSVVQALSSAAERGVRVYVLLDKVGFEEILDNSLASPIHGGHCCASAVLVVWTLYYATGICPTNGEWSSHVLWI